MKEDERKKFLSQMWLDRCCWKDLEETQQAALDEHFDQFPIPGEVNHRRETLSNIFDDRFDRAGAAREIEAWIEEAEASDEDCPPSLAACAGIATPSLPTSTKAKLAALSKDLNNKARVDLIRCFGLISIETFWTRFIVEAGNLLDDCQRSVAQIIEKEGSGGGRSPGLCVRPSRLRQRRRASRGRSRGCYALPES